MSFDLKDTHVKPYTWTGSIPIFSSSPINCAVGADPAIIVVTFCGTGPASGALINPIYIIIIIIFNTPSTQSCGKTHLHGRSSTIVRNTRLQQVIPDPGYANRAKRNLRGKGGCDRPGIRPSASVEHWEDPIFVYVSGLML